jgi:hypothetical protein
VVFLFGSLDNVLQVALAGAIIGTEPEVLGELNFESVTRLFLQPSKQIQDLQQVLLKVSGNAADVTVVRHTAIEVAQRLAAMMSERAGVPVQTLFPVLPQLQDAERQTFNAYKRRILSRDSSLARDLGSLNEGVDGPEPIGTDSVGPYEATAASNARQQSTASHFERSGGVEHREGIQASTAEVGSGDLRDAAIDGEGSNTMSVPRRGPGTIRMVKL